MSEPVLIVSRFNRVMAIATFVAATALAVSSAVGGPAPVVAIPAAALLAFIGWAALWRPLVRVDDEGVLLRNVTHSVEVPWAALISVDTQYALRLHTPHASYSAWSAPAPGALRSAVSGRRESPRERQASDGQLRPGDLLGTESGEASLVVRERWKIRREAGLIPLGAADAIRIRRHWDPLVIGTTAVLIAATLLGMVAAR